MAFVTPPRALTIIVFAFAFACGSTVSAQSRLTVVSWNIQSGQADPQQVATRIRAFQDVDLWGFSEVQNNAAAAVLETAAEDGENADFRRIVGSTGGEDRLVIIYDSKRFLRINNFQLHSINQGNHRAPLVAQLRDKTTGQELLFMVNHLARANTALRHRQAGLLRRWAKTQTLPVIAVGDYNFDWRVEDGDAHHDPGYDRMTADGIFTWVRPERLIRSQCSEEFDSVLDFVFVANPASSWSSSSEIIVVPGDCPDDNHTPDHRPVIARFEMQAPGPSDASTAIQPSSEAVVSDATTDPIFIGAGDIGRCPQNSSGKYLPSGTMAEATAKLVASLLPPKPEMGVVFVAGDNAYQQGTKKQYKQCYDPTWGRFKDRTRPVPGNHEFFIKERHGIDYYTYFGESAGKQFEGYYSYDLGEWHIIALNSELKDTEEFKEMTKQQEWLREDLANNQRKCTLAYWHRPVFSSGHHGTQQQPMGIDPTMLTVWRILDAAGVDVVVNGHDHNYQRFNPQDANQNPDPNGMVEFVVGTGGENLDRDDEVPVNQRRNSAAFNRFTWGILKLTLHPDSYDFEFIPVASKPNEEMFREKSDSPVKCVQ